MHKQLGLQHHRHTGKRLPHQHTSHHALLFVLLIGSLAFSFMQHAVAASYDVSAKVSAVLPVQTAIITSPSGPDSVVASSYTLSGTCEISLPAFIVSVWRSGVLIGSTICSASGTFSINFALYPGLNSVIVRVENITNDYGPDSQPLSITYTVPVATTPPSTTSPPSQTQNQDVPRIDEVISPPTTDGVKIVSGVDFIRFIPNQETAITIDIRAGDAPYTMVVDWGDGTSTTYTFEEAGEQVIKHTFKDDSDRSVKATITDTNGKSYSLVLGATTTVSASVGSGTAVGSSKSNSISAAVPYVAAGTAVVVTVSVVGSYVVAQGGTQGAITAVQHATRSWRFRVRK